MRFFSTIPVWLFPWLMLQAEAPGQAPAPGPVVSPGQAARPGQGATTSPAATPGQTPTPQLRGPAAEQLAAAEARYRSAIALNPQIAAYHYSLAVVLERQQRSGEALRAYAEAVKLDSLSDRNRGGYGELLLKLGETTRATTELRAATRLNPAQVRYHLLLSEALAKQEQWLDAANALREAARLAPSDTRIAAQLEQMESHAGGGTPQPGRHDLSDFEDETAVAPVLILEVIFGIALVLAGTALLLPVLGIVFLVLVQGPREWLRRRAA